jgi:peptidoglycan-N-acetylglucosamine deacetylase
MKVFLFSIDLEDVRFRIPGGEQYAERVPAMIERYLAFLERYRMQATFFTVGDVAEKYPKLIRSIVVSGHEIACHSHTHITLDQHTPASFRADLLRNIEALTKAGATNIKGFRAPTFSLTERTVWAYEILKALGFVYSSSVLPARNPLFGWEAFGAAPKQMDGVWEIPMSIYRSWPLSTPVGGGVYFRVLPFGWVRRGFRYHFSRHEPVLGYFHPYDIDTEQERFMHPEINESRLYNFLLFYNRKSTILRLEKILASGVTIMPYSDYVNQQLNTEFNAKFGARWSF